MVLLQRFVIKKYGKKEPYNKQKIINAINKSASRTLFTIDDKTMSKILNDIDNLISEKNIKSQEIPIALMHNIVEKALEKNCPDVAKSYQNYRNYKTDFVGILDKVFKEIRNIRYIGDNENANTDSSLVATKRSLIYGELNKELYKKFFLNDNELNAIKDGYIYIHDLSSRFDFGLNCCLFDMATVLKDGFEMGNLWYNEPKTLEVAFDVISDVILSVASNQYGKQFAVVKLA